jgi:hypothetical protein
VLHSYASGTNLNLNNAQMNRITCAWQGQRALGAAHRLQFSVVTHYQP